MTPRHPPESPDGDGPSELLRAVHRALSDLTPTTDPADKQPATGTGQKQPSLVKVDEVDADETERDRIEAYLRGPTAFTA
jgi:hypothetical protein